MRLGGQMDHTVELMLVKQIVNEIRINDIAFDKRIVRRIFNIGNVLEIASISQQIKVQNMVTRIIVDKAPDDMRADKTCASGDKNLLHSYSFPSAFSFNTPLTS